MPLVAGWIAPLIATALAYLVYVLLMAGVLRVCGVPRSEVAKWPLRQADWHRLTDLLRAARSLPPGNERASP